jgi:hypothetical protein
MRYLYSLTFPEKIHRVVTHDIATPQSRYPHLA